MAMRVCAPNTDGRGGKRAQYNKLDTRQRAIENNENTYWSPYPCKKAGHVGIRRTSSGRCLECEKISVKEQAERRRAEKRAIKDRPPVPRSLAAAILLSAASLTPTKESMEPKCQPKTKKK